MDKSNWISVDDAMPEDGVDVLVAVRYKHCDSYFVDSVKTFRGTT